jgi:hypothetical protein
VRELRQALFGVPDAGCALDPGAVFRVGSPEADLVGPVGLVHQSIGQAERLEHLDRATRHPVGLSHLQRTVPAIDDHRPDIGEVAHLRGQDQAGGAASDDQDVGGLGNRFRPLRHRRMRVLDERIAGPVTVEIELHRRAYQAGRDTGYIHFPVLEQPSPAPGEQDEREGKAAHRPRTSGARRCAERGRRAR